MEWKCLCLKDALERGLKAILTVKTSEEVLAAAFQLSPERVDQMVRPQKSNVKKYPYSSEALKYTRRTLLGVSQQKAADMIGVALNTWQAYENSKFRMPDFRWRLWLRLVNKAEAMEGEIKNAAKKAFKEIEDEWEDDETDGEVLSN